MKVAPIALSFLLFAFIPKLPLAFSDDAEPVIDTSGNPVAAGDEYLVPAIGGGRGGGLIVAQTGNSTCPVSVLLDPSSPITGVKFFRIPETSLGPIYKGIPIYIDVAKKPDCVESPRWNVFVDSDIDKAYVGIGGPEDHPGEQMVSGYFSIQGSGLNSYKFVFCISGPSDCLDIGIYDNGEGGYRLVLTDQMEQLVVVFMSTRWNGIRSVV